LWDLHNTLLDTKGRPVVGSHEASSRNSTEILTSSTRRKNSRLAIRPSVSVASRQSIHGQGLDNTAGDAAEYNRGKTITVEKPQMTPYKAELERGSSCQASISKT
ncbi:MAG: hypothetical protein M3457_08775, partial [Chloroflexota bacterium]|nr:hypothetical protein [Chloroflexota bacterium]